MPLLQRIKLLLVIILVVNGFVLIVLRKYWNNGGKFQFKVIPIQVYRNILENVMILIGSRNILCLLEIETYQRTDHGMFLTVRKEKDSTFLDVMKDFDIFLMEPDVLLSIVEQRKNITNNVFTFGLRVDKNLELKVSTLDEFNKHSFKIFRVVDFPSKVWFRNRLSHVFLYHHSSQFLIHLVMFYERGENFIWSDSLLETSLPSWLPQEKLSFGKSASGYNRLQIAETYLYIDKLTIYLPVNVSRFVNEDMPESAFRECNHTRVNQFYTSYPNYKVSYRNYEWRASWLLKDLRKSMDDVGLKFILDGGTLLGWYRQCDLIHDTTDMDIEIYAKTYNPSIKEALISHGFYQTRQLGHLSDSLEMTFRSYYIPLDIFLLYEKENYNWFGGVGTDSGEKFRFILPKFKLCWGELLGTPVRVPCKAFDIINATYGNNWYKPPQNWIWNTSPKNILTVGKYTEEEMKEVIQLMPPLFLTSVKEALWKAFHEVHYFFIYLNILSSNWQQ